MRDIWNNQVGSEFFFTKQLGTRRTPSAENPAGPPGPSGVLFCGWEVPVLGVGDAWSREMQGPRAECLQWGRVGI